MGAIFVRNMMAHGLGGTALSIATTYQLNCPQEYIVGIFFKISERTLCSVVKNWSSRRELPRIVIDIFVDVTDLRKRVAGGNVRPDTRQAVEAIIKKAKVMNGQ